MSNIIKLGSIYLDSCPVEIGAEYAPGQIIEIGKKALGKEVSWVPVNGLLVSDRCLLTNISWDDLDAQGLVFGKEVKIQGFRFTARLLKVGNDEDVPNEWDAALDAVGDDNALWHCGERYFWGQESVRGSASGRALCGYNSARNWGWSNSSNRDANLGFRPVLGPLPTAPSDLRHGQEVIAIGCDGCVVGNLADETQYDLIIQPKANEVTGVPSFAINMRDGTLAVDRSKILSIATA